MNEFNVLLAAATNGTPSGSLFDALFARYIAPQESWRELESPLPITIFSAGEDLIDYRIYGNTEQTGTPTPKNPIAPSGCGERTENLFDKNAEGTLVGYRITSTGNISKNATTTISDYVPIIGDKSYTIVGSAQQAAYSNQFYDSNKNPIGLAPTTATITAPSNAAFLRITMINENVPNAMIVEGSTAPTSYIPFGYKLPMVVTNGTATTTTPIYIGSNPLAEDEYVDFGEQKIYRMVNGTLTPTDPPAPIPALPTIQGETIIDYNPSTTPAVEPEKMYIKYKPQ